MNIVRVVYEAGIEAKLTDAGWRLESAPPESPVTFPTMGHVTSALHLRPLLITEALSSGRVRTWLLDADAKNPFAVRVTDLVILTDHNIRRRDIRSYYQSYDPIRYISYLLGAVGYHCTNLAELYAATCNEFSRLPIRELSHSPTDIMTHEPRPYWEFDALVTAARRTYDAARFLLWQRFGDCKRTTPRSFAAALLLCGDIPGGLRDRLQRNWDKYGALLTQYRDCIQHYVSVDFGLENAVLHRLESGVWSMRLFIPDNPSSRSKRKFTYTLRRDALKYGYEVACELLHTMVDLVDTSTKSAREDA